MENLNLNLKFKLYGPFNIVELFHIFQEANQVVDHLARIGNELRNMLVTIWVDPSKQCSAPPPTRQCGHGVAT